MPQAVQHKFAGEADNFLAVHNRLTDLAMLMIEARDENWRIRKSPGKTHAELDCFRRAKRTLEARDVRESVRCAFWLFPARTLTEPNLARPTPVENEYLPNADLPTLQLATLYRASRLLRL